MLGPGQGLVEPVEEFGDLLIEPTGREEFHFADGPRLLVVEDESSPTAYRLEIGPFPGWQTMPEW